MDSESHSGVTSVIKVETDTELNASIDVEYTLIKKEIDDDRLPSSVSLTHFPIEYEKNSDVTNGIQTNRETTRLPRTIPALCTLCNTEFPNRDLYEEHVATAHVSELPYQCRFCAKRFKNRRKQHLCEKSYRFERSIQTHKIFVHEGYKRATCDGNGAIKPVKQLHSRKAVKNPNAGRKPPENFPCPKCDRVFPWKSVLQIHIASHSDNRPFSCEICWQTFNQLKFLNRHVRLSHKQPGQGQAKPGQVQKMRLKSGIERRICKICGKTWASSFKLAILMRIHTGERPFKCDHCELTFISNTERNYHTRLRHSPQDTTGLRSWLCRICGEGGFKVFLALQSHVQVHHGFDMSVDKNILKPYECGICGKPFYLGFQAVTCALLSHNPERLQEKMFRYKCRKCPTDFGYHNLPYFRRHWESRHPGLDPPKKFKVRDYYREINPTDAPAIRVDQKRTKELRWGDGLPTEVTKTEFPLCEQLELLPELHREKKKYGRTGDKEDCELCGMSLSAFHMDRHLQSCKGQSAKTKTESGKNLSIHAGVGRVKVWDTRAIKNILKNQVVTVSVARIDK